MKKLLSILLILMLMASPAHAVSDYVVNLKKAMYDITAVLHGLPKIEEAVEVDSNSYYWADRELVLFLTPVENPESDDVGWVIGCGANENTKTEDFLLACTCVLNTINKAEDETMLMGKFFDLYIKCLRNFPTPTAEVGPLVLMIQKDSDSLIFAAQLI
jgi:hypothetical protein